MSFEDKFHSLVAQLSAGTAAGRLQWEDTADEDTYRIALRTGLIQVNRFTPVGSECDETRYALSVFNNVNKLVERYDPEAVTSQTELEGLWQGARRSAMHADQVIDSLLKEVGGKG